MYNEKNNAYERAGNAMPVDEGAAASGYKAANYRRYGAGYYHHQCL